MRDPYTQSDSNVEAFRKHGCTLHGVLYLRRFASSGDEAPVSQGAIDKAIADLQADSGASMADFLRRGTTMTEADRAYEHDRFEGRIPPVMQTVHGGSIRNTLLPAIRTGKLAGVCVDYGAVQDGGKGVGTFRGGHFVVVGEPDADEVTVADSLRHQTVKWSIELLVKAAETFGDTPWRNGRGEFGIVDKAPTWLELARTQRDDARKERDAAIDSLQSRTAALQAARRDLAECVAKPPVLVPTDQAALDAEWNRALGSADDAIADLRR